MSWDDSLNGDLSPATWFKDAYHGLGGGNIGGGNAVGLGGAWNAFTGDPKGVIAAYNAAISQANQGGQDIKNFLLGQQQKALANYGPLQHMFNTMYGTGGIAPAQVPQGAIGQNFSGGTG